MKREPFQYCWISPVLLIFYDPCQFCMHKICKNYTFSLSFYNTVVHLLYIYLAFSSKMYLWKTCPAIESTVLLQLASFVWSSLLKTSWSIILHNISMLVLKVHWKMKKCCCMQHVTTFTVLQLTKCCCGLQSAATYKVSLYSMCAVCTGLQLDKVPL
jgi:hypothetical protein